MRLYDLTRKEPVRELYNSHAPALAHFGDAEHTVVLFHDTHVTLVNVQSGAHRDLETPTPIVKLEVAGPIAYYIDPQHQLWKLDLAGGAPSKLPVEEPIDGIAPSPDGRWVALAGAQHFEIIDRTKTEPPQILSLGIVRAIAWQPDSKQLAALTDDEAIQYSVDPTPQLEHRYFAGTHYAVAVTAGRMFTTGPTGVTIPQEDAPAARINGLDFTLGLRISRDDVVIAARPMGFAMLTEDGDRSIVSPVRLSHLETSPRGAFVVASTDGKVLIWDLDAMLPHSVGGRGISAARFVTGDQIVAAYVDGPAQWIDLHTNKTTSLVPIVGISELVAAPDGHRAVIIDGTHHGWIVAPVGDPIDLGNDLDHAAFVDDTHLVLASSQGTISIATDDVISRKHPVVALAATSAQGGWVAAAFEDRVLWRHNVRLKTSTQLDVDLVPARDALALTPTGDVVFGAGNELRVWRSDGTKVTLAKLSRTIGSIVLLGDGRVLAISHDGSATISNLAHPSDDPLAMPLANPSFASDGSLVGSLAPTGAIEIYDPSVDVGRWTLGQPTDPDAPTVQQHRPYVQTIAMSPDGQRLLAVTNAKLLVWTLALPLTAEATNAWGRRADECDDAARLCGADRLEVVTRRLDVPLMLQPRR